MGLPDSQSGTYAAYFALTASAWIVGVLYLLDVIITRFFNSKDGPEAFSVYSVSTRLAIPYKLYVSWYLYLLGAAAVTFGAMHRWFESGDDISHIHKVACVALGIAAICLLLVAAHVFFAERNTAPRVVLEAIHRDTGESFVLGNPTARMMEDPSFNIITRQLEHHERAPDDSESPSSFRWIMGPVSAHIPWSIVVFLLVLGHIAATLIITNNRSREVYTHAFWLACCAILIVVGTFKFFYGPVAATADAQRPIHDPLASHRRLHCAIFVVAAALHAACGIIALIMAGPCDDVPTSDDCGLSGVFTYRALIAIIACVGVLVLVLAPLAAQFARISSSSPSNRVRLSRTYPCTLTCVTPDRPRASVILFRLRPSTNP